VRATDKAGQRAVEALASALIIDGHRRSNPFAFFRVPSPSVVTRLPVAKEAKTVRRLAAAVQRSKHVTAPALAAAREAEAVARSVERAIVAVGRVEKKVRAARLVRDAMRHGWHAAYDALKRGRWRQSTTAHRPCTRGCSRLHAAGSGPARSRASDGAAHPRSRSDAAPRAAGRTGNPPGSDVSPIEC
jgi:hypothetical protein